LTEVLRYFIIDNRYVSIVLHLNTSFSVFIYVDIFLNTSEVLSTCNHDAVLFVARYCTVLYYSIAP